MTRRQGQPPRGRATRWSSSERLCGWSKANAISQPNGRELDDEMLVRAGRGHVEWKPQGLIEAGELVFGTAWGALVGASIADLANPYSTRRTWRMSSQEIVVLKFGLADVDAAWLAMERI